MRIIWRLSMPRSRGGTFPRIGNLEDSSLIARKIGRTEASIFAAPALIAAHGMSLLPSDLTTYPLIGEQIAPGESQTWTLHHAAQDPVKVEFKPRMCANSVRAISEAIEAGIGIGRLPTVIGRRMVAEGTAIQILPGWAGPGLDISLIHPASRGMLPGVCLLIDTLSREAGAFL
ncbi:LysR substrate-binding domain-containing protein [Ensifer adhaerens]|uniref:LysR substrate-binding domain-containing protein n=2 Tax=Sinorhizobium/Ensifer group TaxID=227292 RepID=UPI001AECBE3F|nr:LysR substrate-binding domain-containing protein [Ensifer adhaerens]